MSLINEALKKAQRQRNEEQADLIAPMPGGGGSGAPLVKRTSARSTQSIMLLATGGIALFVVCVVVSVIWINRPAPRKPMAIKSSATKSSVPAPAPAIIVVPLPSPASGVSKTIEPIAVPVAGRAPA
ncbi:MAG: hypothetical protein H7343_24065, partial [Undibacterium sp.]|nr:hypothetical protein [Opitutaceae bacterium]